MHHQIEEGAEDAGTYQLELPPQFLFRLPPYVGYGRQYQEDRSVREVGPTDDFLDAIEHQRARRLKQDLFIVGVELPHRETATGREPTERIREPGRQAGEV